MARAPRTRILIVEDHATTRIGIRQILEDELPDVVLGEAGDLQSARARLAEVRWDLLLLDIGLPDGNGLELLRDVREPPVKVLVYSAHAEDQFAIHALRLGAAGYLTKERAPEELTTAVREILAGGRHFRAELAARLARDVKGERDHGSLSARELEVLRLTASGMPGKTIATELGLSPKTVSTYRARLLRKLGLESTAALVRYAVRHGLI